MIGILLAVARPLPAQTPRSAPRIPDYSRAGFRLPNVLSWNTFQGSYAGDEASALALDNAGNILITGTSRASWGSPVNPFTLSFYGSDAFVAKLDRGGALLWNTFLGSGSDIIPFGLAQDGGGRFFVAGNSQWNPGDLMDIYIAKLDRDGNRLWNKTYGSSYGHVTAQAIAADGGGNLYVAGDYPESCCGFYDGFVDKFDSNGNRLWTRHLNWTIADSCRAIALGSNGDVFVTGHAYFSGNFDVFVAKIDQNGNLRWTKFLGGRGTDNGLAIALDGSGNIYAAGYSSSRWGAPLNAYAGGKDAFVAKLDDNGDLIWNAFYGGAGDDGADGLAVDEGGDVYFAGHSAASWGSPQRPHSGLSDIMLAKLDPDGRLLWNTFFGGAGNDQAADVALHSNGHVHLAGSSSATWGTPLNPHRGGKDAVMLKIAQAFTVSFSAGVGGRLAGNTTQVVDYRGDCSPVTAVPDSYCFFLSWTGTGGFIATTENPAVITDVTEDKTITAHFRKILSPIQQLCERVQNRSSSQVEYINILRWSANPGNADLPIGDLRIYEIVSGPRELKAQVGPQTTEYRHRNAGTVARTYHIVCLVNGVEGEPLVFTL
ncbi:MAG TPA: SBBP repeat-containing protein [Candidatus Aminicenantes bacterium]|nr:SBBP repeat-containing protein [Candidatus Aminicenantes bacterium]